MKANYLINLDKRLTTYLKREGDSKEILLQKKIWILANAVGLPALTFMAILIWDSHGTAIMILNLIFFLSLSLSLVVFHFYKTAIEEFALFSQCIIVVLSGIKLTLFGGLPGAGAPIFIGIIGPLYALTLPKKKRAVILFIIYICFILASYAFNSKNGLTFMDYYHFTGFIIGFGVAFLGIYYYTSQVERLKKKEKRKMQELDEFKTRFYTNITHEFRTPLTVILGMSEKIRQNAAQFGLEGSQMIRRNAKNLLELTNQMLKLSKLEAKALPVTMTQNDIIGFLKYLVESFHSLAEDKNLTLNFKSDVPNLVMDFDPSKIKDIMSNLISNGIKFTPSGGHIEIRADSIIWKDLKCLLIKVKDNGIGIPQSDISKVFDRYYQVNHNKLNSTEGSGIGLALTKQLVLLMDGEIVVKSNSSNGSVFSVYLPIYNRAELTKPELFELEEKQFGRKQEQQGQTKASDVKSEKLKILIVEDNTDVVRYLQSILSEKYNLLVACNGLEGMKKSLDTIPDLVISDIMMPVMDGMELLRRMKNDIRTSHIPIILLTAKADSKSKLRGLDIGADAYINKPFDPEELELRIRKLIELRSILHKRYKDESLHAVLNLEDCDLKSIDDRFMKKVNNTIQINLHDEEFGIETLCQSMGMSRSQLYRKFSALTNTTLHQYIMKLRLLKGKFLLVHSDLNVSEVAFETGFKSLSHFSTAYSSEFGIAPSKERAAKEKSQ